MHYINSLFTYFYLITRGWPVQEIMRLGQMLCKRSLRLEAV